MAAHTGRRKPARPPAASLGVAFAADGRRGWAVGSRGTIVATKDGGGHWTPQISSTSVKDLQGVASAADGRQGWAVGEDGTIVATEDGGTHWIVHQRLA